MLLQGTKKEGREFPRVLRLRSGELRRCLTRQREAHTEAENRVVDDVRTRGNAQRGPQHERRRELKAGAEAKKQIGVRLRRARAARDGVDGRMAERDGPE